MRIANRLYALFSWAIVVIGVVHMLATFWLTASTPAGRVWFFGSGIAMALAGTLNLLNRKYGRSAPGLRAVCCAANVVFTSFTAVAGAITSNSMIEIGVIMSVVCGALVLSLFRSSLNPDR